MASSRARGFFIVMKSGSTYGRRLVLLLVGMLCLPAVAGTLQTRFSTVTVHDVPVGYWTWVQLEDGTPYTVENTSDQTVTVTLKASKPFEAKAVGSGFQMIPDASWITVEPSELVIGPNSTGSGQVNSST